MNTSVRKMRWMRKLILFPSVIGGIYLGEALDIIKFAKTVMNMQSLKELDVSFRVSRNSIINLPQKRCVIEMDSRLLFKRVKLLAQREFQ